MNGADGSAGAADARLADAVRQVCERSLEPVGVDGGGVTLVTHAGHRATVCWTDPVSSRIEELQFVLGEGPCVDASSDRSPVLVADLLDRREGVQDRWPGFLEEASAAGVRAVFAFPLRFGAVALGAMDFYRSAPGALSHGQVRAALLAADAAALLLLDYATDQRHLDAPEAGTALHFAVHRAAGMAMVQLGSTIEHALVRLRGIAFAQGRPIDAVAADVVHGRLRFDQEDA